MVQLGAAGQRAGADRRGCWRWRCGGPSRARAGACWCAWPATRPTPRARWAIRSSGIRIAATAAGGFIAGLGGASLTLFYPGSWNEGISSGQGLIAVALVIFARWSPLRCVGAALLFGGAGAIGPALQSVGVGWGYHLFNAVPYVLTLVILVHHLPARQRGRTAARASCRRRADATFKEQAMSGLGGLNKSPHGVVVGLVQLQLPVVETPAQLAAQTAAHLRHGGQGAAQPGHDGPGRVPRVLAARPVDGHRARA